MTPDPQRSTPIQTHITEIIYSHEQFFVGKDPACDCGWRGVCAGTESHADHLAGALVADLFPHIETDVFGRRRYVTDWEHTEGHPPRLDEGGFWG